MESRTQLLALKLLIFEVTDGCNRTLTDDVAEQFVLLFGPASPWRSTIRRVDFGGMHGHYEMRLVHRTVAYGYTPASQIEVKDVIETLCQDLCDPDGLLSPRRVNPNPNLVFTVGVDPNSPTDDLFLCSFIRHSARSMGSIGAEREAGTALDLPFGDVATACLTAAAPALLDAICKPPNQRPGVSGQNVLAPVITTVVTSMVKAIAAWAGDGARGSGAGDAQQLAPDVSEQMTTTIQQAISLFAELESISTNGGASGPGAPTELQTAKEHFEQLRAAMSTIASRHAGATTYQIKTSKIVPVLIAVTMISCSLLNPGIAATVAAWLPESAKGFNIVLPMFSTAGSVGSWMRATKAKKDASLLGNTNKNVHHRLYSVVLDALRTDYRYHPNAPRFAQFAMGMAAAVNPAVLKDWSDEFGRREVLNGELKDIAREWANPGGRGGH